MRLVIAGVILWATAFVGWAETGPRIVVSGEGEISAPPDVARVVLGVTEEAQDAESAMAEVSARMRDVFATLEAEGVEAGDVQTSGLRLFPVRDGAEVLRFRATNQITVNVYDLQGLGRLLVRTVADGANDLGGWQTGVRFDLAQPEVLEAEARRAAVADAQAKARVLAAAAGVTLGPIREMREMGAAEVPIGQMRAASGDMPIAEGEITVRARVEIVFDLVN